MTIQNIIVYLVVGLIAGFLASRVVMGKGRGWLWNMVIGVLGAIIGGWLAGLVHLSIGFGIIGQIIIAFIGAVILLLVWRAISGRRK